MKYNELLSVECRKKNVSINIILIGFTQKKVNKIYHIFRILATTFFYNVYWKINI